MLNVGNVLSQLITGPLIVTMVLLFFVLKKYISIENKVYYLVTPL